MLQISKKFTILALTLTGVSLLQASPALADRDRGRDWGRRSHSDRWERGHDRHHSHYRHHYRHHHHHHYPSYGRAVVTLPGGFINVVFGGRRYYYCDGVYYNRRLNDYVVVRPPRGVVISLISGYKERVVVNGTVYYVSNGVYYLPVRNGYQVVEAPANVVQAVSNDHDPIDNYADSSAITVNIPNHHGGYTAVVIKKSGDGFIGPQGEFYSEFPKVDQLKVMYAQK